MLYTIPILVRVRVRVTRGGGEGERAGWLFPRQGGTLGLGRSGPNLKPGTAGVCCMSGLRNGLNTTHKQESTLGIGRSGPNLKPGTVGVCCMTGLRNGLNTTHTLQQESTLG